MTGGLDWLGNSVRISEPLIDLQSSKVTARGLEHVKGMSSLKRLLLAGTLITGGELR
jgi:hypothetical protein